MIRVVHDEIDLLTPFELRAQIFRIGLEFSTDYYGQSRFGIRKVFSSWNFQISRFFRNWALGQIQFAESDSRFGQVRALWHVRTALSNEYVQKMSKYFYGFWIRYWIRFERSFIWSGSNNGFGHRLNSKVKIYFRHKLSDMGKIQMSRFCA